MESCQDKAIEELKWKPRPAEEAVAEAEQWFSSDACTCGDLSIINL